MPNLCNDDSNVPSVAPASQDRSAQSLSLNCRVADRLLVGTDALTYRLDALVRQGKWTEFSDLLTAVDNNPEFRGAPLMKALNVPLAGRHRLFPLMIFRGASAELLERTIELGAIPTVEVMFRDPRSPEMIPIFALHLALLMERTDVVALLLKHRHRTSVLNGVHETACEQYARLARTANLHTEECALRLGSLVRRELHEGIGVGHIVGLIRTLCTRKAWIGAEMVTDALLDGPERPPGDRVFRGELSEITWDALIRHAPDTLVHSLSQLRSSELCEGAPAAPRNASRSFLIDHLPGAGTSELINESTWLALQEKLELLERALPFVGRSFVSTLLNASYNALAKFEPGNELVDLGLESPPSFHGVWTLVHAMVYNGAPLALIETAISLGSDLSLQAVIQDNDEALVDGTPLHAACRLKRNDLIEPLIRLGAPLNALNKNNETPLLTFFQAYNGNIDLSQIPLLAAFISAGAPLENVSRSKAKLDRMKVGALSLGRALELVTQYGEESVHPPVIIHEPVIEKFYPILEKGKIVEAPESKIHRLVLEQLEERFGVRRHHITTAVFDKLSLKDALAESGTRKVIEALHTALHPVPPTRPPAEEAPPPTASEEPAYSDSRWSEPDADFDQLEDSAAEEAESDDSRWLDLPDFSDQHSDTAYGGDGLQDQDEDSDWLDGSAIEVEELPPLFRSGNDRSVEAESSPSSDEDDLLNAEPADVTRTPLPDRSKSFDEIMEETLFFESDEEDLVLEEDESDDTDLLELEVESAAESMLTSLGLGFTSASTTVAASLLAEYFGSVGGSYRRGNSYSAAIYRFLQEGSPHEAYILLEAMNEVNAQKLSPLHATTRALRTLLFRSPPGLASFLGYQLDSSAVGRNPEGYHPYLAEYLCLLNHPRDSKKDAATIGGLTMGISSIARLMHYGQMNGHLAGVLGRIGSLNFSFPFWRWDAVSFGPRAETLLEMGGFTRFRHPATEYWINPETGKKEHLLGPAFVIEPDDRFHGNFDNVTAIRLGYASLDRKTTIVLRRAGMFFSHPDRGVIFVRNSSHEFGRDRVRCPAKYCPNAMSAKRIVALTPKDIEQLFMSMTGEDFFERVATGRSMYLGRENRRPPHAPFVEHAEFLLDQFHTVRVGFGRQKFDTHLPTAWSSDGATLIGGYYSPLFRSLIALCEELFEKRVKDGSTMVPDLTVNNPDYPPLGAHARISITEQSLEVLKKLAAGRIGQITQRDLSETGIDNFLTQAFHRGKNSELTLLPPIA